MRLPLSPNSLSTFEIQKPFIVLDEIFKRTTPEHLQETVWSLATLVIKNEGWRAYDPYYLYQTYKDLCRLTDVLWLISRYSPALMLYAGSPRPEIRASDDRMYHINNALPGIRTDERHSEGSNSPEVASFFLNANSATLLKINLQMYVQVALDVSYMTCNKHDYFAIAQEELVADLNNLITLIREASRVYETGSKWFPNLQACEERILGINTNRLIALDGKSIDNPAVAIENFYRYDIRSEFICNGIKAWAELLYARMVWKSGSNPGNLIYLHDCLHEFIEASWLLHLDPPRIVPGPKIQHGKNTDPFDTIRQFFSRKKLHAWRATLDSWLLISLSNMQCYDSDRRSQTAIEINWLLQLVDANQLIIDRLRRHQNKM